MRSAVPALATLLLTATLAAQSAVPTPAAFLGFEPGTDRKLASYDQVYAYFTKLVETSDRVRFSSIGRTTEDHDLGFAIISSAKNLANLEEIRKTNLALVDPRRPHAPGQPAELVPAAESAALVARGKTIVCLNASIHSTEVGPTQATLPLAHFLATTQDPEWLKILDDVVLLMLPCHNPDGYLKVVDWYRRWVGTPYEGCPFPGLYHTYAGHDNNRDWFMFNLQETRLTVKQVYLRWVPQIVIDSHQMGADGPRMFIPPYQDPIEPNVDPILIDNLNELGESVRSGLLAKGLRGIVNRSLFDAWSPSRAYMHYHGGVRFLMEIASCRMASPIEKKGLASAAESRSATNPEPWSGDRWSLADIVRYHNETALAVLRHASANRERWLSRVHEVFQEACAGSTGPAAFEIPVDQGRRTAVARLLDVLRRGGVEFLPVGDLIIVPRGQPFFGFARALLEHAPYPVIRESESRPIRRPYDVTAHNLGLLLNLECRSLRMMPRYSKDDLSDAINRVELSEYPSAKVRLRDEMARPGTRAPWLQPISAGSIGVFRPFVPNVTDEGWLRFVLDSYQIPYHSLTCGDVQIHAASLDSDLRVLILPSLTADQLLNGYSGLPPEYAGGIGDAGAAWIERFVRAGGTLIALKDATALPIRIFKLPLRDVLAHLPEGRRVNIPGAILQLEFAHSSPVPAMFDGAKAFEPAVGPDCDRKLEPITKAAWAPVDRLRLDGYAEGLDLVAGKAALVECKVGAGRVVLFGFSPQFRGQAWSTYKLLLDAIDEGGSEH